MSRPTLSVITTCSEAVSKEFYLRELVESVWEIADEIIVVNGDQIGVIETTSLLYNNFAQKVQLSQLEVPLILDDKIKIYNNPWQKRMGCMMGRLQRSLAISHATQDYVMLLDADEIIHEKDHDKIRQCLELGHTAYAWHTVHFYRDYNTIKIPGTGSGYYDYRANLFRNNSYIFDAHDSHNGYQGTVYATMADNEINRNYLPLIEHPDCKKTSIKVMHYGHTRSEEVYLQKTNEINKSYHPDYKNETKVVWDMSNTEAFKGTHPKIMRKRIESF